MIGWCSLLAVTFCKADVITWTGATDTVWANGANWVGGVPAGTNDTAIINNTSNQPYIATLTQVTLKRLEVNVGASLRVGPSGILTVQNTSGPAVHNRGTIMTAGFFQHTSIGGGGLVNYFGAVVEVQPGGTLSFAEVSVVCFQNLNGATLINNGTISFNTVDQPFSGTGLISGGGTFQSTLVNGTSTFSPGTSPGKMTSDAGPGNRPPFQLVAVFQSMSVEPSQMTLVAGTTASITVSGLIPTCHSSPPPNVGRLKESKLPAQTSQVAILKVSPSLGEYPSNTTVRVPPKVSTVPQIVSKLLGPKISQR